MTKLEKKRDEMAVSYVAGGYGCDGDTSADSYRLGFNAMLEEHNRIVAPLIEALSYYSAGVVRFVDGSINTDKATKALDQYKSEVGE